jgi:geranylgeranyl diphosphate synthase type I
MPQARTAPHRVRKSAAKAALLQAQAHIRSAVRTTATREFAQFLETILAQPGRALSENGPTVWPRVVVEMALALGGPPGPAALAAAAVELAVTGIDVADELMDNDWQGAEADRARAQNASVAFAFLATACAAELSATLGPERATSVARLLAHGSFACSDGQDMDVLLERTTDVTEDIAHEMTRRKSGSLIAMACRVGAAIATTDTAVIDAAGRFGVQVGIVAQLMNDLNDVSHDPERRKGDLQQRKKTLPVAFALRCAQEDQLQQILDWYATREPRGADEEQALVVTFHDLGAQQYTWTVAEVHRREALDALKELERVADRRHVRSLRAFIPTVQTRNVVNRAA